MKFLVATLLSTATLLIASPAYSQRPYWDREPWEYDMDLDPVRCDNDGWCMALEKELSDRRVNTRHKFDRTYTQYPRIQYAVEVTQKQQHEVDCQNYLVRRAPSYPLRQFSKWEPIKSDSVTMSIAKSLCKSFQN